MAVSAAPTPPLPPLPPSPPSPSSPSSPDAANRQKSPRRGSDKGAGYRLGTWVRNVGLIVLLFVAFQLWGTGVQERRYQLDLKRQFDALAAKALLGDQSGGGAQSATIRVGTVVARLQIPRIK